MIFQALVILLLVDYAEPARRPARFYLTVRNRPNEHTLITNETAAEKIDFNVPLVMITHGWTSSWTVEHFVELSNGYVNQGKNVIAIDWERFANTSYLQAVVRTKIVGIYSGQFVAALFKKGLNLTNVHAVGHSLGAHVMGFVGKTVFERTGKKVGRITGLDPAGISFYKSYLFDDEENRLDNEDATLVVVLNTNIVVGVWRPLGTVTFYANDGVYQPGCPFLDTPMDPCNHQRSVAYMIESLTSNGFVGRTRCDFFSFGFCDTEKLIFNEDIPLSSKNKIYYFSTNSKKPYAMG